MIILLPSYLINASLPGFTLFNWKQEGESARCKLPFFYKLLIIFYLPVGLAKSGVTNAHPGSRLRCPSKGALISIGALKS